MGDRWEYETKKLEIAWELASLFIKQTDKRALTQKDAEEIMSWSRKTVAETFPAPNIPDPG